MLYTAKEQMLLFDCNIIVVFLIVCMHSHMCIHCVIV